MRIGLVIQHFDPHRGGAEHWTYQFAMRLLAGGHEVHVVAEDFLPAALEQPVVAHGLGKTHRRLEFAAAAEAKLRTLGLDVIHDMGAGWYCDIFESHDGSRLAQWQQKLQTLPRWVRPVKRAMIRVLPRYRQFHKLLHRQFADRDRLVLALSKMVARDYQHYHGVRPEQIRLIYNGVDIERFSPENRSRYRQTIRHTLGVREHEVLLLFVGHDFQRKGLATAIRAAGRLTRAALPIRLAVVGGRRAGAYGLLARRCGAGEVVRFLGSVRDTVPYYAAADVYVLPTFYDPCSLGVLEAAASGLPSVTTQNNGAGELLTDGVDGWVVSDPSDDAELARRLETLLDKAVRLRIGDQARKLALRHTLQRNCDRIVAVYQEIAQARRRAA